MIWVYPLEVHPLHKLGRHSDPEGRIADDRVRFVQDVIAIHEQLRGEQVQLHEQHPLHCDHAIEQLNGWLDSAMEAGSVEVVFAILGRIPNWFACMLSDWAASKEGSGVRVMYYLPTQWTRDKPLGVTKHDGPIYAMGQPTRLLGSRIQYSRPLDVPERSTA